jgi:glycosyltransferase
MKKFVKVVPVEFINEARDNRELQAVHEIDNINIIVVAKGAGNNVIKRNFYEFHTLTTRPVKWVPVKLNRILAFFLWARYIRALKADIISCHDIICLAIGYISTLGMKHKVKLIYDSHEFELGLKIYEKRIRYVVVKCIEKFLMKHCVFSMMVNDSIANEVQKIHQLKKRPVVVRNIPTYKRVDENVIQQQRERYKTLFHFTEDDFIVLYHGVIMDGRGIENIIKAIADTEGVKCIVLGFGEDTYMQELKKEISANHLEERVVFHDAVPQEELWKYVGAVDVGIVVLDNICLNHYYCLPNKFFQNIQAHTPIIGSDFPELKRMIKKYNIGLVCKADSPEALRDAIIRLKNDKELYKSFKENLKIASKELCWENEKRILIDAYKAIL